MEKIKRYKTGIIVLSVLSAAGIGYFIYSKIRIRNLNKKVQSLQDFKQQIDNLPDVELGPNDTIPPNPELFPADLGAAAPNEFDYDNTIPSSSYGNDSYYSSTYGNDSYYSMPSNSSY